MSDRGAPRPTGDIIEEEHEEHINHEAWVIPYADMLTLLMGLFVILYAMSTLDLKKFEDLKQSFSRAFNSRQTEAPPLEGSGGTVLPEAEVAPEVDEEAQQALRQAREVEQARRVEAAKLSIVERHIWRRAGDAGVQDSIKFRHDSRGLGVIIRSETVLFPSGSAQLRKSGFRFLRVVAGAVDDIPNPIQVEGHTDNQPIRTSQYPTNWELSTARATTVLRTLIESFGIRPYRLSASGYGAEHPIATNSTADGRAENRRVEILIRSDAYE